MDSDFLLYNLTGQKLYEFAKKMPIFDYHCHLSPKEIFENNEFTNIGEMWLKGDHYKWRLMRNNGVSEKYITGDATYFEKFEKFIECLQYSVGNPMYHWCKMELSVYFDVDDDILAKNTKTIWDKCNQKKYTPQKLIEMSNVYAICTTDDPKDNLDYHIKLKNMKTKVLPTFRPNLTQKYYVDNNITDEKTYLVERMDYFNEIGCKISDHGLDEFSAFSIDLLKFLANEYEKRGWTMQLHIGAIRNNNKAMYKEFGADIGFDSVNDLNISSVINNLLGDINNLPKTILYSLNPVHNAVLATITGNFRNVQHGSAWWFNDHYDGMIEQMKSLASVGAINKFIGMLTDSRSFLSYTRHDYFRRILCNLIGEWVEKGQFINDIEILKKLVEDISFYNAKSFLDI